MTPIEGWWGASWRRPRRTPAQPPQVVGGTSRMPTRRPAAWTRWTVRDLSESTLFGANGGRYSAKSLVSKNDSGTCRGSIRLLRFASRPQPQIRFAFSAMRYACSSSAPSHRPAWHRRTAVTRLRSQPGVLTGLGGTPFGALRVRNVREPAHRSSTCQLAVRSSNQARYESPRQPSKQGELPLSQNTP